MGVVVNIVRERAAALGEATWARLPVPVRNFGVTAALRTFGLLKIPMIAWVSPRVVVLEETRSVIEIPLNLRTKNHVGSMYLGVLMVGADVAAGTMVMRHIVAEGTWVDVLFRDARAEFLRKVDGDARFTCADGDAARAAARRTIETGERVDVPLTVVVTSPAVHGDEPLARVHLTLSMRHGTRPAA